MEKICPLLKTNDWSIECDLILEYFCPFSAIPIMQEAMKKDLEECPFQ